MSGYGVFARYYDELTRNINYKKRAAYIDGLIKSFAPSSKTLLDLACGTGSLSIELSELGYQVTGVDASPDMLSVAANKSIISGKNIIFINQLMQKLTLNEKVDVTVCALDSINHVIGEKALKKAFERTAQFLKEGGLFIFDVNSKHKHFNLLSGQTYVYDSENVYCVWQNGVSKGDIIDISLDFFEKTGNLYKRYEESFCERFYSHNQLVDFLDNAGFELLKVFADDSTNPPEDQSQRLVYVAKKPQKSG